MTAPGWYYAEGDPVGSTRYWDGTSWQGEPVVTPPVTDTVPGMTTPPQHSAGPPSAGYAPGVGQHGGGFSDPNYPQGSTTRDLGLASAGARIGARIIDGIIGLIIIAIIAAPIVTGIVDDIDALGPSPTDAQIEDVINDAFTDALSGRLAVFGIIAVVWDFFWVGLFGGTPGKLILGLRVAANDTLNRPPGWGRAALRLSLIHI